MFGTFRLLLALLVFWHHVGAKPALPAHYAVWSFYVLSGFLMTLILNTRYGFDAEGRRRFAVQRTLRIYPPYWIAILLGALLVICMPAAMVEAYHPSLRLPADAAGWLTNLGIFGLLPGDTARLAPPAWALFVELVFYVLLALGLARSQSIALVWLGVAGAYHVAAAVWGWDRYFSIPAAGLAFAAGALTCHASLRRRPPALAGATPWLWVMGLYVLFIGAAVAGKFVFAYSTHGVVLYLNVLVASACVYQLFRVEVGPRLRTIDGFLGDLSYPVYLIHWQVALAVHWLTGMPRGDGLLLAALGPVLLCAWAMEWALRRPVAALRGRLLRGPRPRLTAVEVSG